MGRYFEYEVMAALRAEVEVRHERGPICPRLFGAGPAHIEWAAPEGPGPTFPLEPSHFLSSKGGSRLQDHMHAGGMIDGDRPAKDDSGFGRGWSCQRLPALNDAANKKGRL
ncbi:MAG: hypothetical protein M1522_09050 [Actinobacteria bacterium]|nr:hypothetical protein [Actinomycetota bacterium]